MSDLLRIGIAVLLFTVSMYLSHILINAISPLIILIAASLLTLLIVRALMGSEASQVFRPYSALVLLGIFVFSLIVTFILRDFVKVIAWLLTGWYMFRVLLYLVAEDMYKDLNEFLNRAGGG